MMAEINDHFIHYEIINPADRDSGIMIIFLHEGLGSIAQWKAFPEEICHEIRQPGLVYERHGYGQSSPLTEKRKTDYMHREAWSELPELLKKIGINEDLILVGHSDGATISLLFAAKYPNVKALVSIAAHVVVEDCTIEGVRNAIKLYEEYDLKYLLEKYHDKNTDTMFYGWADAWTSSEFRHWNITEGIRNISCPLLLIQGENDEYASLRQIEEIKRNVKGECETLIVPNCGHIPHLQHKKMVKEKIVFFLKRLL